ncbi:hypothetical protein ABT297_29890 [Dactylosporangium sp. NPDC000555]|uniref:hypothetical protein n=1 Tax=Dactylosporangium sp. NPDC000555 TaxID=3154260 RepID=UPI00331C4F54
MSVHGSIAGLASVLLAFAALSGCGEAPGGDGGPTGTVAGTIVLSGGSQPMTLPGASPTLPGASPAEPPGAPGTVTVSRDGGEVARQKLTEGERFQFSLPPGTYELRAVSVDGICLAQAVTVAVNAEQDIKLVCQRK